MTSKNDLLQFLVDIDKFKDFETKLSNLEDQKLKGDLFELFCQTYLVEIHNEKFKSVELFSKIKDPSILERLNLRLDKDYGIDIVAITESGDLWAVQCKFRSQDLLTWRELSTFFGSSQKADFRLVMGNISQVLHPMKDVNFSAILKTHFEDLDKNDFNKIKNYLGAHEKIIEFTPKPHQEDAINNALKHFENYDKGRMIHACGTGKTLTSLWIKEKLKPKNSIVFLPSLSLLKQTLDQWSKHRKDKFSTKCVCSDKSVVKDQELDEIRIDITELGVPVTTDKDEIVKFLKGKEDKIVFSTYQSADVVLDALKGTDFKFDFGVFDEAHRTSSRENKLFSRCLSVPVKKKLFMTATPKIFAPRVKTRAQEEDILLCSMDDEKIYGKVFHEISFGKAIELGLLSDYKIKIITLPEKEVKISDISIKELIDRRYWLDVGGEDVTADNIAKAWTLIQSMNTVNHVISFHSRVKDAKIFQKNVKNLLDFLKKEGKNPLNVDCYHISGTFSTHDRKRILDEFISKEKSLVTNARCLTEGVDVPAIDGVYFVDPKKNLVDIVQATGRAIRKKKDSEYGYIIIPVFVEGSESADEIVNSSAFDQVWRVIEAMKDQDERLQQTIEYLKMSEGKKKWGSKKSRVLSEARKKKLDDIFDLKDSILPKNLNFHDFLNKISVRTIDVIGKNWDEMYGQLVAFYEKFNKEPDQHSNHQYESKLGKWCSNQRTNYKKGILQKVPERLEKLKKIGFVWDPFKDTWEDMFQKYREFRIKNGTDPNQSSKDLEERRLALWCGRQRVFYKKGLLDKSPFKLKKLEEIGFVWDYLETEWENMYKLYIDFKSTGKEPNNKSKDERGRNLAQWCGVQRKMYKKGILKKYPERIKKLLDIGFSWDLIQSQWEDNYNAYIEFKTKNKKEPYSRSEDLKEQIISNWCQKQRHSYKDGSLRKFPERIKKLEAIGFRWNPLDSLWTEMYEKYLEFKQKNNREPNSIGSEKVLWEWCNTQKKAYNKGKFSEERLKRLEEISFSFD